MTSSEISRAKLFLSFVTGPIPIYTGSIPSPAWYRTLHPHTVLACRSHRVLTVCIPPPLKYVMLLWNIHTFANHHHAVRYAPRPPTVLIPGSHRVPPLVPTWRKVLSMPKTFAWSRRPLAGHQRVHRSLNASPCVLTVFHRPHTVCVMQQLTESPVSPVSNPIVICFHKVGPNYYVILQVIYIMNELWHIKLTLLFINETSQIKCIAMVIWYSLVQWYERHGIIYELNK